MADSDKEHGTLHSVDKVSDTPVRRSRGQTARRHCTRFWWIYLLVLIALILIIVLPIIFVGFPHRAQKDVNDSRLDVSSLSFTNPTPEGLRYKQEAVLRSNSSYHPTIDSFNATFFLEDTLPNPKAITYVQIPGVKSTGDAPVNFDQDVKVANLDQLTDFCKAFLKSDYFRIAIRGKPKLHQGSLSTNVDYNEVVTLKGLNNLEGFNVTSFEVKLAPESDGANLLGKVSIPNPSVFTIELGNVTLNLNVTGTPVGTAKIQDLTLKPGDNTFDMRAYTNTAAVLSKLSQSPNGVLDIDISGNSSVYNGQHLKYYEDALSSSTQRVSLNIGGALKGMGG